MGREPGSLPRLQNPRLNRLLNRPRLNSQQNRRHPLNLRQRNPRQQPMSLRRLLKEPRLSLKLSQQPHIRLRLHPPRRPTLVHKRARETHLSSRRLPQIPLRRPPRGVRITRELHLPCQPPPILHPPLRKQVAPLRGIRPLPTHTWAWGWLVTMISLPPSRSPI